MSILLATIWAAIVVLAVSRYCYLAGQNSIRHKLVEAIKGWTETHDTLRRSVQANTLVTKALTSAATHYLGMPRSTPEEDARATAFWEAFTMIRDSIEEGIEPLQEEAAAELAARESKYPTQKKGE